MSSDNKISQPVGTQTADFHEWRRTLRSPSPGRTRQSRTRSRSPSPSGKGVVSLRSRSPSPSSRVGLVKNNKGGYLTDVPKTSQKKETVANTLRKSTGTMDLATRSSKELGSLEAEYIRNLQQQVYFLELEANYLREQARKATDIHPQMVQEADRMLSKLRLMQEEMDRMAVEMQRKESAISILQSEKERLNEQITDLSELRAKDKRLLMDEVVTLKLEKDKLDRELSRRDSQLLEAKSAVDKSTVALTNAETKIQTLKAQLEQRIEQHKLTQLALEEKRQEVVSIETQLREVEDKYYSSTVQIQDKVTQDLRDEIRFLRQKLKETELSAEKDRYLRDKINDDSSHLIRENATLSQKVAELDNQLEREKSLRDSNEQRHATKISEMVGLRDKEGALRHEIGTLNEQIRHEQQKCKQYLDQLSEREISASKAELRANTAEARVAELESLYKASEDDVRQLRQDKVLLVEHVADLQKKFEEKDRYIIELRADVASLESRVKQVEYQKSLELNTQSQKWEELGRMAENMRTLSSTMAHTATPRSKLHI